MLNLFKPKDYLSSSDALDALVVLALGKDIEIFNGKRQGKILELLPDFTTKLFEHNKNNKNIFYRVRDRTLFRSHRPTDKNAFGLKVVPVKRLSDVDPYKFDHRETLFFFNNYVVNNLSRAMDFGRDEHGKIILGSGPLTSEDEITFPSSQCCYQSLFLEGDFNSEYLESRVETRDKRFCKDLRTIQKQDHIFLLGYFNAYVGSWQGMTIVEFGSALKKDYSTST